MIPATINITAVEQVGDYVLRLSFDDNTVQKVDFKPFLSLYSGCMKMRKTFIQNLIVFLVACSCLVTLQSAAQESKDKAANAARPDKQRLVLMPLRVPEGSKNMQAAMSSALVFGLQQRYEVFEGERVAQKAREIFLKESRNMASTECNEVRCMQNIAEAFQSELIAVAYVTKIDGGYLLSLNIQNIFDNKVVYSNTLPCQNCNDFQVVEYLKVLDSESMSATASGGNAIPAPPVSNNNNISENALWDETQRGNRVADYRAYLAQFPRGRYASIAEGRINLLDEEASRALTQKDQDAWNKAINVASIAGYEDYLKRYPKGLYLVQAQARINKMQTSKIKAEGETKPGSEFRDCQACPEMVIIPAGQFNMGSNNGSADEQPVHRVTIGKTFAIGKTEVTQGQWRALMSTSVTPLINRNGLRELAGELEHVLPNHKRRDMTEGHFDQILETSPEYYKNCGDHCTAEERRAIRESAESGNAVPSEDQSKIYVDNNPSYFRSCGDECPVEQVSWEDAQKYIQKLIAKTGKKYRLPSEAEWEYACRGGANNEYCGSDKVGNVAWYGTSAGNSGRTTHVAATLNPNGFGLFDMSGNVWEWVEDNYHMNYNGAPLDGSAWTDTGARHVFRGGAWSSKPQEARAAQRGWNPPFNRGSVGFRVVRVLP